MKGAASYAPYLAQLRELPFVKDAQIRLEKDAIILLVRTPTSKHRLNAVLKRSHLDAVTLDAFLGSLATPEKTILLAPSIGRPLARRLQDAGVAYLDRAGNCSLQFGDRYIARIEGRRPERSLPRDAGIRAPGYQVLFAYLAQAALLNAPVRHVAERAGASRQTAADVRRRLIDTGYVLRGRKGYAWDPHRLDEARDEWLRGYHNVLRPTLLLGRYRMPQADPIAREQRLAPLLAKLAPWRWGGGPACYRLTGHYRGPITTVHLSKPSADLTRQLGMVRANDGDVVVLGVPGPIALEGATADTVHPLLVWSELLVDRDARAREAAALLLDEQNLGAAS